jgi:hypothetical protein
MADTALQIPSLKDKVSPEEWAVRVDLAACYRLVVRYGWEDLVFTHITARVPGTQDQFLINPYGVFFDEITASSLVKIDQEGRKLDDSQFAVNPAGFIIHSAIHGARHDAKCVLHAYRERRGGVDPAGGSAPDLPAFHLGAGEPSAITTSRARPCGRRESRASWRTSGPSTRSFCATTVSSRWGDGGGSVREHVLPRDLVRIRCARGQGRRAHSVPKEVIDDSYARMQSADRPGGTRGGTGVAGTAASARSHRSLVP